LQYGKKVIMQSDDVTVPVEVAKAHLVDGVSLIRAWREHLGLTQEEVSVHMGVSRSGYSQMERPNQRPRRPTLQKIAAALGVMVEQLTD
jgi:DNA-binding XRE family transcriptional regulator